MLGSVVMGQVVSVTVFSLIGVGHVISGKGYQDLCEISLDSSARSDIPSSEITRTMVRTHLTQWSSVSQTFGISLVIVYPLPGVWNSAILIC